MDTAVPAAEPDDVDDDDATAGVVADGTTAERRRALLHAFAVADWTADGEDAHVPRAMLEQQQLLASLLAGDADTDRRDRQLLRRCLIRALRTWPEPAVGALLQHGAEVARCALGSVHAGVPAGIVAALDWSLLPAYEAWQNLAATAAPPPPTHDTQLARLVTTVHAPLYWAACHARRPRVQHAAQRIMHRFLCALAPPALAMYAQCALDAAEGAEPPALHLLALLAAVFDACSVERHAELRSMLISCCAHLLFASKTCLEPAVLQCCAGSLTSVTVDEWRMHVHPVAEKALLRNPETVVATLAAVVESMTFDFGAVAQTLLDPATACLRSVDATVRAATVRCVGAMAHCCTSLADVRRTIDGLLSMLDAAKTKALGVELRPDVYAAAEAAVPRRPAALCDDGELEHSAAIVVALLAHAGREGSWRHLRMYVRVCLDAVASGSSIRGGRGSIVPSCG